MKIWKQIIRISSKLFPFDLLKKTNKEQFIFPFYHLVSNKNLSYISNLYSYRSTKEFEKDLDFLQKHFTPATIEDFISFAKGHLQSDKKYFLLSFDDGLRECYDTIAPILQKRGLTAIFFINSAFVDNKQLFYRFKQSILIEEIKHNNTAYKLSDIQAIGYSKQAELVKIAKAIGISFDNFLKQNKPYMSLAQIKELVAKGFSVGAHSIDHPLYSDLTLEEQIKQTAESIEFCKAHFGVEHRFFAFPFTDDGVGKDFFEQIKQQSIVDYSFGTAGLKKDSITNNFQRIPVEKFKTAKSALKYEYLYYLLKSVFNQNIIKR